MLGVWRKKRCWCQSSEIRRDKKGTVSNCKALVCIEACKVAPLVWQHWSHLPVDQCFTWELIKMDAVEIESWKLSYPAALQCFPSCFLSKLFWTIRVTQTSKYCFKFPVSIVSTWGCHYKGPPTNFPSPTPHLIDGLWGCCCCRSCCSYKTEKSFYIWITVYNEFLSRRHLSSTCLPGTFRTVWSQT